MITQLNEDMSVSNGEFRKSIENNWFWLAAVIAILFGYTFGKDVKMRDRAEAAKQHVPCVDIEKST
jgi:hypothetical protein